MGILIIFVTSCKDNRFSYTVKRILEMKGLVRGFSLALIAFAVLLLFIFTGLDFEVFGEGVKINGLYYVFMGVLLSIGLWLYMNRQRFDRF